MHLEDSFFVKRLAKENKFQGVYSVKRRKQMKVL